MVGDLKKLCLNAWNKYVDSNCQCTNPFTTQVTIRNTTGFYEEVCVIDPYSLDVLFQLSSRINPDWISAFHVLRQLFRNVDLLFLLKTFIQLTLEILMKS